jgi:hypothetical protein
MSWCCIFGRSSVPFISPSMSHSFATTWWVPCRFWMPPNNRLCSPVIRVIQQNLTQCLIRILSVTELLGPMLKQNKSSTLGAQPRHDPISYNITSFINHTIHLSDAGPRPLYSFKGCTAYLFTLIYSIVYSVPVILSLSNNVQSCF